MLGALFEPNRPPGLMRTVWTVSGAGYSGKKKQPANKWRCFFVDVFVARLDLIFSPKNNLVRV